MATIWCPYLARPLNDLFKAGLTNDKLCLLYCQNKTARIAINTPSGKTERVAIHNTVMQGTVWAGLMCTSTMDKLGRQAYSDPNLLYKYRGDVDVPPLQMVDDVIMASKCGNQVVTSNSAVSTFIKLKKLKLSETKCARIHVSKSKCEECPKILVNEKDIKESPKEKYLGDYLTESATATETIKDRKRKGYGILGEMRAILEDIPLGNRRLEIGLTLREAWFLNGTLYNSEVWGSYNKEDIEAFEVLDRIILCLIVGAHSKSANEMLYLDTGVLPISSVISVIRMTYIHTLLQRHDEEISKQIYQRQLTNPYPGDWAKLILADAI